MSAIVGIYNRTGRSVDCGDLSRMTDILAHRGPDGHSVWAAGPIGLGHRMLWTTPESLTETLPFADDAAGLTITADARIDNRDDLLPLLGLTGRPAEMISDSQVILAAYKKWGEHCPEHLLGDFAFAIWDAAAQKLFCARDHFGVKPFYYYVSEEIFVFATEIKALLCLPDVPQTLNELRVGEFLTSTFNDKTNTSYEDVLRLTPAHRLVVSPVEMKLDCYWSLDPTKDVSLASDEEYAQRFREIFSEAVRCRLRSSDPVGCLLSGGLDSSSIARVAVPLLKSSHSLPLDTFSGVTDVVAECDERGYISNVVEQGDIRPHYISIDGLGAFSDHERTMRHQDEMGFAPNLFLSIPIYRAAREQGVRVLLNGHDGDNTVSHGFGRLDDLAAAGQWLELVRQLNGVAKSYDTSAWKLLWNRILAHLVIPNLVENRAFQFARRAWLKSRRIFAGNGTAGLRPTWARFLNEDFFKRAELGKHYEAWQRRNLTGGSEARIGHFDSLMQAGQPMALEILDKAGAMEGIEFRYPFWDKRLVEFCLALPADQKLKQGWSRYVLRKAMQNVLPPEIQWRRNKNNFLPYLKQALLRQEKDLLNQVIWHDSDKIAEFNDIEAVRLSHARIMEDYQAADGNEVQLLWACVSMALWLKFTGLSPKPVLLSTERG